VTPDRIGTSEARRSGRPANVQRVARSEDRGVNHRQLARTDLDARLGGDSPCDPGLRSQATGSVPLDSGSLAIQPLNRAINSAACTFE